MTSSRLLLAVAATVLLASGCGTPDCLNSTAYLDSAPVAPLRIPDGMGRPDRAMDMGIPGGAPVGGGTKAGDGTCLAAPPAYFASADGPNPEGLPVRQGGISVAARPGGAVPVVGTSLVSQDVAGFLTNWADTWTRRDAQAWFGFYASDYVPAGYDTHEEWQQAQLPRFEIPAATTVEVGTLEVVTGEDGRTKARFVQTFGQAPEIRRVVKEMLLVPAPDRGDWRIVDERIVDIL